MPRPRRANSLERHLCQKATLPARRLGPSFVAPANRLAEAPRSAPMVVSRRRAPTTRETLMKSKLVLLFTSVIASVIGLPSPSPGQQALRVGATMSLTGKQYSVQGGYGREGYLLCEKHVNAQGGVLGRPVQLVI